MLDKRLCDVDDFFDCVSTLIFAPLHTPAAYSEQHVMVQSLREVVGAKQHLRKGMELYLDYRRIFTHIRLGRFNSQKQKIIRFYNDKMFLLKFLPICLLLFLLKKSKWEGISKGLIFVQSYDCLLLGIYKDQAIVTYSPY